MSNHERTKVIAFSAIATLAGLLIVIISAHTLFSELLFYSIVVLLMGIIVVLVAYAFLWERTRRYVSMRLWKRKSDRLAREYFDDFRGFVDRLTSFHEFGDSSKGIIAILDMFPKIAHQTIGVLANTMMHEFEHIVRNPVAQFKQRLDGLHWKKKEVNYEFLSCLVKEFEGYVTLHKRLYVDFAVIKAREIGLDKIPQATKRVYSDYKDDYNQFIVAYTEFARRSSKAELRIFNENLQKASEL